MTSRRKWETIWSSTGFPRYEERKEPFEENRDGLLKLREVMNKVGCKALIAEGEGRKAQANPLTACGGYTPGFGLTLA